MSGGVDRRISFTSLPLAARAGSIRATAWPRRKTRKLSLRRSTASSSSEKRRAAVVALTLCTRSDYQISLGGAGLDANRSEREQWRDRFGARAVRVLRGSWSYTIRSARVAARNRGVSRERKDTPPSARGKLARPHRASGPIPPANDAPAAVRKEARSPHTSASSSGRSRRPGRRHRSRPHGAELKRQRARLEQRSVLSRSGTAAAAVCERDHSETELTSDSGKWRIGGRKPVALVERGEQDAVCER